MFAYTPFDSKPEATMSQSELEALQKRLKSLRKETDRLLVRYYTKINKNCFKIAASFYYNNLTGKSD